MKGRAAEGPIMISENEMNHVVSNCKSEPTLFRIQNPGNKLVYKELSKGIQYLVPMEEWKEKANK